MTSRRLASLVLSVVVVLAVPAVHPHVHARLETKAGAPTGAERGDQAARVKTGVWGGPHVRMEVSDDGADVEFDCARGAVSRPLTVDRDGRFKNDGTYVAEHGGPVRENAPPARPARYTGRVSGDTMHLTVTLVEGSEEVGAFTLSLGNDGDLVKCR